MAERSRALARVLVTLVLALVVGAVIMVLSGKDPWNAYRVLLESALGNGRAIANTLLASTPLIFTGMATVVAFRAGIFNVGVEGSLYLGAFAAAWVGFTFTDLPGIVVIPLAFALAGLVGGIWGLIPGYLKARLRVDEVVTTIMLNYVAILFTTYLVNGPFFMPGMANAMSRMVSPQAQLPRLAPPSQLNIAFPIALVCAVAVILLFRRTTLGYELRSIGANPLFARWTGMPVGKIVLQVMFISGLLGGFAGAGQALGVHYRFVANFSPGFGFDGIAIALLGRSTPIGALLAALFLGALRSGGATMELFTNVPRNLVDILQAIIIFFMAIDLSLGWLRFQHRRTASGGKTGMGGVSAAETGSGK